MITAEDTLKAIESSVLEGSRDDHRNHLGGSIIGDECERKLWYVFRWGMHAFNGEGLGIIETLPDLFLIVF